jgi:hypothetical protein
MPLSPRWLTGVFNSPEIKEFILLMGTTGSNVAVRMLGFLGEPAEVLPQLAFNPAPTAELS